MSRSPKPSGKKSPLFNKERRSADYRRSSGQEKPGRTMIIITEGSETEPNYFNALRSEKRLRNLRVKVFPGGEGSTDPIHLISYAEQLRDKFDWDDEKDEVWCVFDIEQERSIDTIKTVILRAHKEKIALALSNPSFEYWFLLHFIATDRPFINAMELKRILCKYIPEYYEAMKVYPIIRDLTQHAIDAVEELKARSEVDWKNFSNPSTNVDQLVRHLTNN